MEYILKMSTTFFIVTDMTSVMGLLWASIPVFCVRTNLKRISISFLIYSKIMASFQVSKESVSRAASARIVEMKNKSRAR